MLTGGNDVQQGQHGCRLTGRSAQGTDAALKGSNLLFHCVHRRVGQAGVEVICRSQIKQLADIVGGVEFEGRGLVDRQSACAAVFRLVAGMKAFGFKFHLSDSFPKKFTKFLYF